ncbi:RING-14 protein [Ephemerocybe angulata]|uniref:RING-14 protein n=1 Tax=Ephemerocybe angulata TaxID=980116 RepID=A0A8H6ME43_9AGAR|nr:RING-14 protein [Tulosesus angulatus]
MHFSKTYTQILEGLPPELRENAIQYRQLKKLINQVVSELSSLGLSPNVLQELISAAEEEEAGAEKGDNVAVEGAGDGESSRAVVVDRPRIVYELVEHSDRIEPHLKLWVDVPEGLDVPEPSLPGTPDSHDDTSVVEDDADDALDSVSATREMKPATNVLWSLHQKLHERQQAELQIAVDASAESSSPATTSGLGLDGIAEISSPAASGACRTQEVVIPLVSDTAFFDNLISALDGMSTHMTSVHDDFTRSLKSLSRTISASAMPASSSPSFHAHSSITSHPGSIMVSTMQPSKSDLYSWREIFQLYVDAEIFEHVGEVKHGERSSEESKKRLQLFVEQATQRGLADNRKFKSKQSRQAFETFIELNLFILNIKMFSEASAEATRKILKKHTKRTALPLAYPFKNSLSSSSSIPPHLALFSRLTTTSLPRTLVQAIGETLLPIIPHVDDYACLICTSIAFKPIRLNCGHLFCVRCLVKMQKRGQADCPLCRAPVVLSANKSNVDWALLNFMQDWFPMESREKLKANEREAAQEEMIELGLDPNQGCVIM